MLHYEANLSVSLHPGRFADIEAMIRAGFGIMKDAGEFDVIIRKLMALPVMIGIGQNFGLQAWQMQRSKTTSI